MNKLYLPVILLFLVILIGLFLVYLSQDLRRIYQKEVHKGLKRNPGSEINILTEDDLKHLPAPVQKHLTYVGVIGKEKVSNVKIIADGEIKMSSKTGWIKNHVEQYNFFDNFPTRLFYIKLRMFGIPFLGLHSYTHEQASMLGKVAGLITVVNAKGPEMRISDTITLLNDMCLFAPATLIDSRIRWEAIDDLTAKATFMTNYCNVSAVLYFNAKGELVNFISDERYYLTEDGSYKKVRWSTPIKNYRERNGFRLASYGEAVWNLPEGDFCYFRFTNIETTYNCHK